MPNNVILYIARQLAIDLPAALEFYMDRKATRLAHYGEIKTLFDYLDLSNV